MHCNKVRYYKIRHNRTNTIKRMTFLRFYMHYNKVRYYKIRHNRTNTIKRMTF